MCVGAEIEMDYFGLKRQTAATPLGLANFKADDIGVGFVQGSTSNLHLERRSGWAFLIDRSQGRGACRAWLYWQGAGRGLNSTS